ncbi:MAG TPA: triose-phosphate isomerase [Clostridia bacterium]|nr:triose-phosphate isomerase [Clostridia bacterium]
MVVGNWKMHYTVIESLQLVMGLNNNYTRDVNGQTVEIVVCPPFTALADVGRFLTQTEIKLGAQDAFYEPQGAYTGEISVPMLKELNCEYVIVGHSERRHILKEDEELIQKKFAAVLRYGLIPILCVGETLDQRQKGETEKVIKRQLQSALKGISEENSQRFVVAYEPVWAIGTGQNATPEQANEVCSLIRKELSDILGNGAGDWISILYGGSVKPNNAAELISQPEIDGLLVGGASLDARDFTSIINAAKK